MVRKLAERVEIGDVNKSEAICTNRNGPVELWSTKSGSYIVYLRLGSGRFLYKKRQYSEEAEQLFNALARMVKKR